MAPGGRDCAMLGPSRAQVTKPPAFQPLLGASRQNPVLSGQEPCLLPHLLPAHSALAPWLFTLHRGTHRESASLHGRMTGHHLIETPHFSPSFGESPAVTISKQPFSA